MKRVITFAAAAFAATMAVPAAAATCQPTDTTPNATACVGYFDGNIFDQSPADTTILTNGLQTLGVTYSGTFADYTTFTGLSGTTDLSSLFGVLTGTQVIGVHFGGGAGGGISALYSIDFGTGSTVSLNLPASSSVTLFTTPAVPEPATWALMLLGFGGIGFVMRRKRTLAGLAQVA